MKSRIEPMQDIHDQENPSMELQNVTNGNDPFSVDPYAVTDEDEGPQQSLSRHLPSRAVGTRHGTVRRRSARRRGSVQIVEEMENEVPVVVEDLEPVESVKAMPAPMCQKREMRNQRSVQKVKHISCWKTFKLQTSMGWHRFISSITEFFQDIELWKGHLKQVEALNPQKSVDSLIVDFITGQGWINTTIMFYSNYPPKQALAVNDPRPAQTYFFVSLLLMVKNLTKSFEESYIEGGGTFYSYCNKVFGAWDFCIEDENTANVKKQNIFQDINAELAEEERLERIENRTTGMKVRLYSLRMFISFLVMCLLGGAIYAIYITVEISTAPSYQEGQKNIVKTIIRSAPSLTITALNLILPPFFQILSQAEDWSPRFEVALNLWRTVLLRLASVAVLMITLYAEVGKRCSDGNQKFCCRQSWENEIASQMYMLIWIDLFVVIVTTAFMETIRKLLHKHTKLFRKLNVMPEFQIPKNVLDLVYGQCLIWIGTFFSPLIPAMGVVKLLITFYLKKVSLMYNNKPSNRPYQGARSNYLFTVLLLITFFMCLVAVGWGITKYVASPPNMAL
ncbi:hypothetical protein QZH41_013187 [Actinostola sp. cb2023]|nr:hypothetical protein QZH41_013187 [Actinostola sp. cb2023]